MILINLSFYPFTVSAESMFNMILINLSFYLFTASAELMLDMILINLSFYPFTASAEPMYKSWNGRQYLITTDTMNGSAAKTYCVGRNYLLASLHSAEEETAILDFMKGWVLGEVQPLILTISV